MSHAEFSSEKIRVLLVDDQQFFIEGLKRVLEGESDFQVVGEALTGSDAVRKVSQLLPDVVLMDVTLPGVDGINATRQIRKQTPGVQVIMLTIADDPQEVIPAIKAGAMGYLLKDESPQQLFRAIRSVSQGEALLSSRVASILLKEFQELYPAAAAVNTEHKVYERLTRREVDVLNQVAEGLANKEIAQKLTISERTVKNHISNIFQKLHVNHRTQAVVVAMQERLLGNGKPDKS